MWASALSYITCHVYTDPTILFNQSIQEKTYSKLSTLQIIYLLFIVHDIVIHVRVGGE